GWNASGWVRMYLGEYASAIEHFERAMRLSPLDPLTYFASTGMGFAHAFAGRYDEAVSWATKALYEQPNWATALRVAVIANALSGRMVEARAAMACLREVDPALRLGNLDLVAPPLRRGGGRVRFFWSLRKAGVPAGAGWHLAASDAARLSAPKESVDTSASAKIASQGRVSA